MGKIKYELPSYNANPDIPRELDKLVNALDQQIITLEEKDDMEIRFQEQLKEMRQYITTLSESNAIPTLYQLSTDIKPHKYQFGKVETIDNIEVINIYDFEGQPIDRTILDDIGEYVQTGRYTFMIVGIVDIFTYRVAYIADPYVHSTTIYDKDKLRDFALIKSTLSEEPNYDDFEEDLNFVLFKNEFGTLKIGAYAKIKSTATLTSLIELDDYVEIPLFSVFYSTIEKIFKMWDGNDFVDFGQTFIPQSETYTKDKIDEITGLNSVEISKREYVFQSGSNVYIDRTESENPVLNVLNFDALDKTKDAITSLTARKIEDINGYQVILNTLSSAQGGGFKLNLSNVSNDKIDSDILTIQETITGFDEMLTEIKKSTEDTGWVMLSFDNDNFKNYSDSAEFLAVRRKGSYCYLRGTITCTKAGVITSTNTVDIARVPFDMIPSEKFSFGRFQGSNNESWHFDLDSYGNLRVGRMSRTSGNIAKEWMPISASWIVE